MATREQTSQFISAHKLGDQLAKHTEVTAYLETQARHKVEQKYSAAHLLVMLMRTHSQDDLMSMPMPGMDDKGVKGTNYAADIYTASYTKEDGTTGTLTGSFYKDYFERTEMGRTLRQTITDIKAAKGKAPEDDNKFKDLDVDQLDRELSKANMKYNYALDRLRSSMTLFHKMAEISALSEYGVSIDFAWKINKQGELVKDDKGNPQVEQTTLPITLTGSIQPEGLPAPITRTKALSIGNLHAIKPEKALAKFKESGGQMFSLLLDSAKRGTKKDQTTKAAQTVKLGFTNLPAFLGEVSNFLDDGEIKQKLVDMLSTKKHDDVLIAISDLEYALNDITTQFEERIRAIRLADANTERKAA